MVIAIGVIILLPTRRLYDWSAARVLGLPVFVHMTPTSIWKYYRAYFAGRTQAKKDIASGLLVIEESGFMAGGGADVDILRERYHIEVRALAQCVVDETIVGHEDGYNSVAAPEIDRRIGRDKVNAAREEGYQIAVARRQAEEQREKDLARRLTTLPPDSNLTLQAVSLYSGEHPDPTPDVEDDLRPFVHAVEQFIILRIPRDAPAFEMHISAALARSSRPKFETSGRGEIPRSVYDAIYKEIPGLPVAGWTRDDLRVTLNFATRQPQ
jgi:hypothetical protein